MRENERALDEVRNGKKERTNEWTTWSQDHERVAGSKQQDSSCRRDNASNLLLSATVEGKDRSVGGRKGRIKGKGVKGAEEKRIAPSSSGGSYEL